MGFKCLRSSIQQTAKHGIFSNLNNAPNFEHLYQCGQMKASVRELCSFYSFYSPCLVLSIDLFILSVPVKMEQPGAPDG